MLLVFNPKAGRGDFAANLCAVVDLYTKHGYEVTVHPTQGPHDAFELIQSRARWFDCIVCSGGDGMANEAIDALMRCKKRPKLGYIPAGTTNDFASSLGLPRDILDAARVVVEGVPRAIDIGKFGDEYFSYVAAFGMFTDIPYSTDQNAKNMLGHLAYLLEGIRQLGNIRTLHCTAEVDGEALSGEYMLGVITNSTSVAGLKMSPEISAVMDDGLFEVIFVEKPKTFLQLQGIIASLLRGEAIGDCLRVMRASSVSVHSDEEISWTLDGEYGGQGTDAVIENCHRAIEIMVPA